MLGDAAVVLAALLGGCTLYVLARALWPDARAPRGAIRRHRRTWAERIAELVRIVGLAGAAVLALVLRRRFTPTTAASRLHRLHVGVGDRHRAVTLVSTAGPTTWLLVAALVAVAGGALLWSRRSRPHAASLGPDGPGGGAPAAGALETGLTFALEQLRAEPDPRRAVLAAYAAFERGAALRGTSRRLPEAPFEFVARLGDLGGVEEPARRLTELFERARFSTHDVGPEHRAAALEAVESLLAARVRTAP